MCDHKRVISSNKNQTHKYPYTYKFKIVKYFFKSLQKFKKSFSNAIIFTPNLHHKNFQRIQKLKAPYTFYCLYHKSLRMVIRACLSNVYLKITNMKEFHCHMNVAIILVTPLMLNHCKHNMTGKKSNVCNFFSTCVYLINSNLSTLADTETRKLH